MTSTNDGKDVKSNHIFGQKAKTYYIELYKTLEARLSVESEVGARTSLLCEAWRRVHCLCQHSAPNTHQHLISWLQRHTAQTLLQSEWRQLSLHQDKHDALGAAIDFFILECQEAVITRGGASPQWESQLLHRAQWFKAVMPDPWGNAVLKALLDRSGEAPSDLQIVEWLKEERGVFFVTRLRQLASSKKTVDIALSLATAVMERVRACATTVADADLANEATNVETTSPTFTDILSTEAGFTADVWELITDIEFVLLYSDRSQCIALAKQTPLKNGYLLVERLHSRLEISPREKRLWKNGKDVAILIAQVMIARCMVVPTCVGTARTTLYGCSRSLVKLLPSDRLPAAMAALAAPAATARHLHTLAVAVDAECKNDERKPFVCELYIRAITAGMNELEKLKLTKEKESDARLAEKVLGSWFTSLGSLLGASARLAYECALTAFSLHPSPTMYERIRTAPQLQPAPVHKDIQEPASETNSEFGSWATDSRSQTNFVKTSETLNLKKIQQHSNVLSTAVLNEGEALGLSPELCQDLIVLLSGPRVKTLSWDMDKEILIENCRSYMERTHGGTRALTTELKYLNLDPDSFMHLPEEQEEDESDIYYGIEKGYEHLVEIQEPEEIWEDALSDPERTESCHSEENEILIQTLKGKKKGKLRRNSVSSEEEALDPLSDILPKSKQRSHSSESYSKPTKERSKDRSKDRMKKEGQSRARSNSTSKNRVKKDTERNNKSNDTYPLTVEGVTEQPKVKRERKKREKKEKREKKDLQNKKSVKTGLSLSLQKETIGSNVLTSHEQITKRETETDINNQLFITDSDYDSQGKSSIASIHTEGNDPDVLFDGLFSMDDIKSPEKPTVISSDKTHSLQLEIDKALKSNSLKDNTITSGPSINIPKTLHIQNNVKDNELSRPSSVNNTSLTRNDNVVSPLPPWCHSNRYQNGTSDEVKLSIKRLIEFRKQKSATDIVSRTKHELEPQYPAEQNKRKNCAISKKFVSKFDVINKTENGSRILPGTPKAISVPDIPKVFINKKQSQQLNNLKNEVNNYLLNQGDRIESQKYQSNNLRKQELQQTNIEQMVPKSVLSDRSVTYSNLNKFEQKLYTMFNNSEANRIVSNLNNAAIAKDSSSITKLNVPVKNVTNSDQNSLRDFFKELHRSNNAGVCEDKIGLNCNTNSLYSATPINHCAKLTKPPKKVDNAPNTFARLKYMHKNKQGDNITKQTNDNMIQSKLFKSSGPQSVKDENDIIDSLLSRVDCTVIRKNDKGSQYKGNSSKECAPSAGFVNNQSPTNKSVSVDDKNVIQSHPLHLQHNLVPTSKITQPAQHKILTDNVEDPHQHLLRQKNKYNLTRPQTKSELAINKGVSNTQLSNSSLPKSCRQQSGEDIHKRSQGCSIKKQTCQNVQGRAPNSVTIQAKSSSTTKIKSTKSTVRHKSAVVNNKECNNTVQSGIKNDIVQQDWESVLNDLLSHKTPSRSPNVQCKVFNKDNKQLPKNTICDQSIHKLNSTNNINCSSTVASNIIREENDLRNKSIAYQTKQKSRTISVETNNTPVINSASSLGEESIIRNKYASPVINRPVTLKCNDPSTLRKSNQTVIIRTPGKSPEVKLALGSLIKDSSNSISHTHTDSVSNVSTSDYDILGELMDDDLRQEIGEISSDEDCFSGSNVIPKGKIKNFSNKVINMPGSNNVDSSFVVNTRQNQCVVNKQSNPILQLDSNVAGSQVRAMTTGYESTNVIKNKPLHSTMITHGNGKCQARIQKAKTNVIHQSLKPSNRTTVHQHQGLKTLSNNNSVSGQVQGIDARISNNCISLENSIQQSNVICSNENISNDNSQLVTSVNKNSASVFTGIPQQHGVVKNVVLIRPEIVCEPYTVQVRQYPEKINPHSSNSNTKTFLAVNTVPNISMLGARLPSHVINPVIITKAIAVSNTKNSTSLLATTCNSVYSNAQRPITATAINMELDKKSSTINEFDVRSIESTINTIPNSDSHTLREKCKPMDDFVKYIPNVKMVNSILRNTEGNVVTNEEETNSVKLAFGIPPAKGKEPEIPAFVNLRGSNDLDSNKNQTASNNFSHTSLYNSQSEQCTPKENMFTPYRERDVKDMLNKNHQRNPFPKVQEKLNLSILSSTPDIANNLFTETSTSNEHIESFDHYKVKTSSGNSRSLPLNVQCTTIDKLVTSNSNTEANVNNYILNNDFEREQPFFKKEHLNLMKLQNCPLKGVSNLISKKTTVKCEQRSHFYDHNKVHSILKSSITQPISDGLTTIDYEATNCSKTDVNDCMFNESLESKMGTKVQEKVNLTGVLCTPSTITKSDSECSQRSNNTSKVQSAIMNLNSYHSSEQRTAIVINHNLNTDAKLIDCSANKNFERKVLSEVQEKHTTVLPENTILKTVVTEDETKKETLNIQEERLRRKKKAILNRQVHIVSDVDPIPLTYAPIHILKPLPDNAQKNTDDSAGINLTYNTEMPMLTVFGEATLRNVNKNLPSDKINKSNDTVRKEHIVNFQSSPIDGSKENNIRDTSESIRVRLRSSNKEDNSPTILQRQIRVKNRARAKVKLKVKNAHSNRNVNKVIVTKRLTKKRGHKIINEKEATIKTKQLNSQCPNIYDSNKNLDIEEKLHQSFISKEDQITRKLKMRDEPSNKNNVQSNTIHYINDSNAILDQNYKNNVNSKDTPCQKGKVLNERKYSTEIINEGLQSENVKIPDFVVDSRFVNNVISNEPIRDLISRNDNNNFGVSKRDEIIPLNDDDLNISKNKESTINEKRSLNSEQHATAFHHQGRLTACENDATTLNVNTGDKIQREALGDKILIDSFKDNITIEELPRKQNDDPLKRCISIKLANGNSFKATVSGKLQIDINSLFKEPAIRSMLMKNIPTNRRCIFNIQQVMSASGENIRTRLVLPEKKYLETINLISDDEEETESHIFTTEFGEYKVRDLNDNIFNKHQKKLSQKCSVNIKKCNVGETKSNTDSFESNEVKCIEKKSDNDPILSGDINNSQVANVLSPDKNHQIIEIDDSSNDSTDSNKKSIDTSTQPLRTPDDIEFNIKELKETLLKDLCVDVNNKIVATNISQIAVPENIQMNLNNLKETLLKDLCDHLGNTEKETITNTKKSVKSDVVSNLKDKVCQNISENLPVDSTNSDVIPIECSATYTRSVCQNMSIVREDTFVHPISSESTCSLKSNIGTENILQNFKNKHPQSKTCQLKLQKCDDLVKKYQLFQRKRCFVSLERCDKFNADIRKSDKYIEEIENINLSDDGSNLSNRKSQPFTEPYTSNGTLKRSGSFSILNGVNLCEQSLELVKPVKCNTSDTITLCTCVNYNKGVSDKYEVSHMCQSEWFMTKLSFNCIMKQIHDKNIISDDASTDCDSDIDDNSTNVSETILQSSDIFKSPIEHITYQVPSLLQLTLKFIVESRVAEYLQSNVTKSSYSLHYLKRKLSIPENNLNERKLRRMDKENQTKKKTKKSLMTEINNDYSLILGLDSSNIKEITDVSEQELYDNIGQNCCDKSINNMSSEHYHSLTSNIMNYDDGAKLNYEKNALSEQFAEIDIVKSGVKNINALNNAVGLSNYTLDLDEKAGVMDAIKDERKKYLCIEQIQQNITDEPPDDVTEFIPSVFEVPQQKLLSCNDTKIFESVGRDNLKCDVNGIEQLEQNSLCHLVTTNNITQMEENIDSNPENAILNEDSSAIDHKDNNSTRTNVTLVNNSEINLKTEFLGWPNTQDGSEMFEVELHSTDNTEKYKTTTVYNKKEIDRNNEETTLSQKMDTTLSTEYPDESQHIDIFKYKHQKVLSTNSKHGEILDSNDDISTKHLREYLSTNGTDPDSETLFSKQQDSTENSYELFNVKKHKPLKTNNTEGHSGELARDNIKIDKNNDDLFSVTPDLNSCAQRSMVIIDNAEKCYTSIKGIRDTLSVARKPNLLVTGVARIANIHDTGEKAESIEESDDIKLHSKLLKFDQHITGNTIKFDQNTKDFDDRVDEDRQDEIILTTNQETEPYTRFSEQLESSVHFTENFKSEQYLDDIQNKEEHATVSEDAYETARSKTNMINTNHQEMDVNKKDLIVMKPNPDLKPEINILEPSDNVNISHIEALKVKECILDNKSKIIHINVNGDRTLPQVERNNECNNRSCNELLKMDQTCLVESNEICNSLENKVKYMKNNINFTVNDENQVTSDNNKVDSTSSAIQIDSNWESVPLKQLDFNDLCTEKLKFEQHDLIGLNKVNINKCNFLHENVSSKIYNSDTYSNTGFNVLNGSGESDEKNDQLCRSPSNNCNNEEVNNDDILLIGKNSKENITDCDKDECKQKFRENVCNTNDNCLVVSSEINIKTNAENYSERPSISKIDEIPCPKNITLLYESDSKVILKGSILEDPIVGTCYVFPIISSNILRSVIDDNDDYFNSDETMTPDMCNNQFEDNIELIVTKPKVTYSNADLKFENMNIYDKVSRKNLKRKIDSLDSRPIQKKYRKGKNIDYPKTTAATVCELAYSKEFKNLSNYCSSIKFSYSNQFHLMQLDDVHTMLQNWPIKESNVTSDLSDIDSNLFMDMEQKKILDPMKQTLAEEIYTIKDETESTTLVINETNFSMGFGEQSGRVNQNLSDGEESIKISAVTLSDVKQSQPFLQSVYNDESSVNEYHESKIQRFQVLDKCYSQIRLRDQVKAFFRKTTAELNYSWLKNNFKSEKMETDSNGFFDLMTDFPFHLNISEFFEPPQIESIVQVVQVGQLPLSTGAQNPVTCDPRVTQVSDASPPQCSVENVAHDDLQTTIKTEYTELTTADISLPLMSDYVQQHQEHISASQSSNSPVCNDNITIETEVKIEVLEEVSENIDDQGRCDNKDFPTYSSDQITSTEHSFDVNDIKVPIKTEPDVKIVFEPAVTNVNQINETYKLQHQQQNGSLEKPDQLAHAMNAAGITPSPEPIPDTAMDLSNSLSRGVCSETDSNNYHRSNITAMTLQHALAQILPSSLNQTVESENNPQVSVASQILHIVHGNKNTSLNQITLTDNTQQSVISTPTPVLHIVQSKNGPTCSSSNDSPVHNSNSYSGLSLVDAGLSQGGNQLLHIVNTASQKSNNTPQLLKRVNLLTNLTNIQGSNEQKMVQFVCKSTDAKGIQLNTHQRSMVLRLHTIESPQSAPLKPECQETNSAESSTKESVVPQELKSRSVYEENYAKFIQNSNKQPVIEKSTSLPKFNQAFGKPVFQEESQKSNEIDSGEAHLSQEDTNIQNNDCQSTDNSLHLDNIRQIASPPLLLRKSSTHTAAQQNLVQQIKQAINPMNIQTMHGGVIYTRQIPVNIGGGQTINLITVPTTERIDDSTQKQKTDVKFGNRSEIEPSIIKIVPQSPVSSNSEISADESNHSGGVSNENTQNPQPPPMLTQMRIKLPMLSKNPQMVSAARVVRPSFFQIQRNVIGGPNQPVYQQLVLTAAPTLGQQSIRLPSAQISREMKVGTENQTSPESQMSSSTLEQLREFDMVLEQVKERSTVQPNGNPVHDFSKTHVPTNDISDSASTSTSSEVTQQVLYSIGNNQSVNVAYVNRKSTVVSAAATTSFVRSPDSSGIVESPTTSSHASSTHAPHISENTSGTSLSQSHYKSTKVTSKPKSKPIRMNPLPPKPNQKPIEDEQTTQRILYILAEYKEQVENSPDKDKPAPRRRTNLQASVTPPGGSKRKKSSSGSRRSGRDSSPLDDNCRTMGSEDSSCGTSQGDCSESCQELHSPQSSPRKVAKKLSFDQDSPVSQARSQTQQTQQLQAQQSQPQKQSQPQLQRNVLVTDGPTIAVTRAAPGKPATAVLMPANYILPVSMVKSGQQIAIVTNRGPKILTVGGTDGGATNALLLQRLISPAGLKPMLARPGVRHVRLPTAALHNLQAFNLTTAANTAHHQAPETSTSPVPATSPPELIDTKAPRSPWTSRDSEEVKQDGDCNSEQPEQEQEPEREPDQDPDSEPWNVPHDYSYEETVRTEMDRTVLDAIPDRYSPDMEAQRIFDKMFDVESKKGYIDSQDDSPRCPYDIDASDCDDKAYHQVVQRRDGVTNRHRLVSAATLRQKFALMEDELRLQKSLSEECEDLGVDSPSASDLFPEAELLFSSSPAHDTSQQSHTPQPVILNQSTGISKPDLDDQTATDQLISREVSHEDRQTNDIDLGLEDVGIVTVSEDGMRATISLDHEEFVRSHPNTTFHSELTEEGEVQPVTLADLKARHITSTIFHAGRAPATVLVTAPQTTVISQATPDGSGVDHVRCSHADSHDGVTRYDMLTESRELHLSNTTSAIIHSNATQVIRRVRSEREARYFLDDDFIDNDPKMSADDSRDAELESGDVDDDRSSPERHSELFWENTRREHRRLDFSSDSDKCCKSPYDENNSTDSSIGPNMRLDSVIKDARGIDRSDSGVDDSVPPLRTYPPKRTYHHDGHRSVSGKTKTEGRFADTSEGRRRASNRGVVKRGCHCCNGTTAPSKPKKPRQRKPTMDFN